MKHLKEYNQFLVQEAFFTSDYDTAINNLYKRIRGIFDISKLTQGYGSYTYQLEETDSQSGFIEIYINDNNHSRSFDEKKLLDYDLNVDGRRIGCSNIMKRKIYKFFKSKWGNKERDAKRKWDKQKKVQRKMEVEEFRKKYHV